MSAQFPKWMILSHIILGEMKTILNKMWLFLLDTTQTCTNPSAQGIRVPGCQKLQMMARPGLAQDAL